jgi:SAM-dependent methyltransferase
MNARAGIEQQVPPGAAPSGPRTGRHLIDVLRCPDCRTGRLEEAGNALRCTSCGEDHPRVHGVPVLFESGIRTKQVAAAERTKPGPVRGRKPSRGAAYRWREYGIEALIPPSESGPDVLLLGCGDGGEVPYLTRLGFNPTGFDVRRSDSTDFLADAHRIPLEDESYDVVISMQVLEHLHAPWVAVSEVARVLRPGGCFLGSVAFLKPHHGSYFHMTHAGVSILLERAGLQPDYLAGAQSLTYTLYGGLLPFGSRPVKRAVLGAIDRMIASVRARAWSIARRVSADAETNRFQQQLPMSFRQYDRIRRSPAVVFRAHKPVVRPGSAESGH